jgi:hypothetical protein
MDLVHKHFHPLDAAPMFGCGVGSEAATHNLSEVESASLIRHDDGYFVARPAAAADVYFSSWIFLITVHDRIVERFPKRQLDTEFLSWDRLGSFNQHHQAVYER